MSGATRREGSWHKSAAAVGGLIVALSTAGTLVWKVLKSEPAPPSPVIPNVAPVQSVVVNVQVPATPPPADKDTTLVVQPINPRPVPAPPAPEPVARQPATLAVNRSAKATLEGAALTRDIFDRPHGATHAGRELRRGTVVVVEELKSGWARITWTNPPTGTEQTGWLPQNLLTPISP